MKFPTVKRDKPKGRAVEILEAVPQLCPLHMWCVLVPSIHRSSLRPGTVARRVPLGSPCLGQVGSYHWCHLGSPLP